MPVVMHKHIIYFII